MKQVILIALTSLAMLIAGCAVDAQDPPAPEEAADLAGADDAGESPAGRKELPAELSLITNVRPGCAAEVNCAGAKTCTAWTAYTQCAPTYQVCVEGCGTPGRANPGCGLRPFIPQNRTRSCTMRATGAACVEVDYRELGSGCSND